MGDTYPVSSDTGMEESCAEGGDVHQLCSNAARVDTLDKLAQNTDCLAV